MKEITPDTLVVFRSPMKPVKVVGGVAFFEHHVHGPEEMDGTKLVHIHKFSMPAACLVAVGVARNVIDAGRVPFTELITWGESVEPCHVLGGEG